MGRLQQLAGRLGLSVETPPVPTPPPAALASNDATPAPLSPLPDTYRDTLARSAGAPFDWLVAHYFTADDLADIDAGRCADPVALGELIRTDPAYPFGWSGTAPVAALAEASGVGHSAGRSSGCPVNASIPGAADPLANLTVQGLELAGDDRVFIRQHLNGLSPERQRTTLATYARHWLAAMEGKPDHQRQNVGRLAANTWLRNCAP